MPCFHPLLAWRGNVGENGKREILFKRPRIEGAELYQFKLPCGRCWGCRLERSRQWAMRCVHEASIREDNSFITLTYNDEHLPEGGSLVKADFQLFMKRLRRSLERSGRDLKENPVRYYMAGEYGEKRGRPHYHAILFGYDFADKQFYKNNAQGQPVFISESLSSLWGMGDVAIGAVSFESAAYVARYVMKKWFGKDADEHYTDKSTGEIKLAEYCDMSRRPGIGRDWFNKWYKDVYPRDYTIVRGREVRPPKFYDGLYEIVAPADYECMKLERRKRAIKVDPSGYGENGDARLRVKEEFKLAQMRSLSRNLEE